MIPVQIADRHWDIESTSGMPHITEIKFIRTAAILSIFLDSGIRKVLLLSISDTVAFVLPN